MKEEIAINIVNDCMTVNDSGFLSKVPTKIDPSLSIIDNSSSSTLSMVSAFSVPVAWLIKVPVPPEPSTFMDGVVDYYRL